MLRLVDGVHHNWLAGPGDVVSHAFRHVHLKFGEFIGKILVAAIEAHNDHAVNVRIVEQDFKATVENPHVMLGSACKVDRVFDGAVRLQNGTKPVLGFL